MSGKKPWGTSDVPPKGPGLGWTTAIRSFLSVGVVAALYVIGAAACKPATQAPPTMAALARGSMAKLQVPAQFATYPDAAFVDGQGRSVKLSDFEGQAVVLNLWATWCAPCVKEMPTLAGLQKAFLGEPVKVIALSTDSPAQTEKARAFIAAHAPLEFYQDTHFAIPSAVTPHIEGFPTTLLYDREGRLRGTFQGEADWSSPEAQAVVRELLKPA